MPCALALSTSLPHTSAVACVHIGGCTPEVERRVMPCALALSLSLAHTSAVACVHIGGCTPEVERRVMPCALALSHGLFSKLKERENLLNKSYTFHASVYNVKHA